MSLLWYFILKSSTIARFFQQGRRLVDPSILGGCSFAGSSPAGFLSAGDHFRHRGRMTQFWWLFGHLCDSHPDPWDTDKARSHIPSKHHCRNIHLTHTSEIFRNAYAQTNMSLNTDIDVDIRYRHRHRYTYVFICVCIYIYIYIPTHLYVCIYIYIYKHMYL